MSESREVPSTLICRRQLGEGLPEEVSFCSASPVYWTSSFTAVCEPTQSPPDTPSASSHWRLPVRSGTLWNVTGVSINGARLLGSAGNRFPHRVIIYRELSNKESGSSLWCFPREAAVPPDSGWMYIYITVHYSHIKAGQVKALLFH